MILKLNSADNCVQLIKGSIVAIENIAMSSVNNDIMIVGREYENVGSFFNFPCNSSILNIYKADNLVPFRCWKLTDISKKWLGYPLNNQMTTIPCLFYLLYIYSNNILKSNNLLIFFFLYVLSLSHKCFLSVGL